MSFVSTLCSLFLGSIFLAAALINGFDLPLFMRQIQAYGIIEDPDLMRLAALAGSLVARGPSIEGFSFE